MDRISFTVAGQPVGKGRPRFVIRKGKGGRSFVKPYTPAETERYERAVWLAARAVVGFRHQPWTGPVVAYVRVFNGDARQRDADNVLKSVTDALNKKIWKDDCQIVEPRARKFIDRKNPRAEVLLIHLGADVDFETLNDAEIDRLMATSELEHLVERGALHDEDCEDCTHQRPRGDAEGAP